MASPMRTPAGFTQAAPYQPLNGIGIPDPFFYASAHDDFLPYTAGNYTVTAASGSVAQNTANGTGGRILLTTGATIGNFAEIQGVAGFNYTVGKRLAFLTRVQLADIVNSAMIVGLVEATATPFTAITDGIYFTKASAGSTLELIAVAGSTVLGTASITGAFTAAQDIDLGFYVDSQGNIRGFYGNNLEGFKNQNQAILGPNISILNTSLSGALSTANLAATVAVSASTAVAQTMVSDFLFAAQER